MTTTPDPGHALALARSLHELDDPNARADRIEEIVRSAGLAIRGPGASLHDIAPLSSFAEMDREVLRAIAEHHGSLGTVRVVGVPIFEFDVRPWAGVVPPRTIDTEVSTTDGPKPRWLVLQAQGLAKKTWEEAAAVALADLDEASRLDVLLSMAAGAYWLSKLFPAAVKPESIERALAGAGERGLGYARPLVDALAAADSIPKRFGMLRPEHLSPLLRSLHRVGVATPPSLRSFIAWDDANRALLEAIPAGEREALVLAKIEKWGAANLRSLGAMEALADLLATRAVIERLRRIAEESREASEHAERIDALAARAASGTR